MAVELVSEIVQIDRRCVSDIDGEQPHPCQATDFRSGEHILGSSPIPNNFSDALSRVGLRLPSELRSASIISFADTFEPDCES